MFACYVFSRNAKRALFTHTRRQFAVAFFSSSSSGVDSKRSVYEESWWHLRLEANQWFFWTFDRRYIEITKFDNSEDIFSSSRGYPFPLLFASWRWESLQDLGISLPGGKQSSRINAPNEWQWTSHFMEYIVEFKQRMNSGNIISLEWYQAKLITYNEWSR